MAFLRDLYSSVEPWATALQESATELWKKIIFDVPLVVENKILFAHSLLYYTVLVLTIISILSVISFMVLQHFQPADADNLINWLCSGDENADDDFSEFWPLMAFTALILMRQVAYFATMMRCGGLFRFTVMTSWCCTTFLVTKLHTIIFLRHLSRPQNTIERVTSLLILMGALSVFLIHLSYYRPRGEVLAGLLYITITCVPCQRYALSFRHWPSLRWLSRYHKYFPISFLSIIDLVMWGVLMWNLVYGMLLEALVILVNTIFAEANVSHPGRPPPQDDMDRWGIRKATEGELQDHKDEVCPICLSPMETARITACNHLFHSDCLYLCLDHNNMCPVCRAIIPEVE